MFGPKSSNSFLARSYFLITVGFTGIYEGSSFISVGTGLILRSFLESGTASCSCSSPDSFSSASIHYSPSSSTANILSSS